MDYVILGDRPWWKTGCDNSSRRIRCACVITSISFDHMQYLGNTIEAIAGEKAGIIVPGVPVIYDGNDRGCSRCDQSKSTGTGKSVL